MRIPSEPNGKEVSAPSILEAEAAAWCIKRARRPSAGPGRIPVVHIRRRTVRHGSNGLPLVAVSR